MSGQLQNTMALKKEQSAQRKKLIWVLLGIHPGDNAQALALAAQLDAEVVEKPLRFNSLSERPNWRLGATLASLLPESRSQLVSPWPDMVIATGKRTVPVARWIKNNSDKATRLVQLGRPRARLNIFDLVITTPQYHLPKHPRVIEMSLPFARIVESSENELLNWRHAWQHLPKPWLAVFLGGEKRPQRFGREEAATLGERLEELALKLGAGVIIMGSPRTAAGMVEAVAAGLTVPTKIYSEFDRAHNPYQAALQMADYFVITSDSLSMVSEASATGKPVCVFKLPLINEARVWQDRKGVAAFLTRQGILVPKRRISEVIDRLIEEGIVTELGSGWPKAGYLRDDSAIVARIKSLIK